MNKVVDHNNTLLYQELVQHITTLKTIGVIGNDAAASKMKILEELYIKMKDENEILDEEIRLSFIEMVKNIGCNHISTAITLFTNSDKYDELFLWLSTYFKFYNVTVMELVFSLIVPTIEFSASKDKLITSSFLYKYNACTLTIKYNGYDFVFQGMMNIDQNAIYNEPHYRDKYNLIFSNKIYADVPGKLGETMVESAECAKTLAWKLLTDEEKTAVNNEYKDCPDASMPKDGPSAGVTLTTVIYSYLVKRKIDNKVAMTGEVDLLGNAKAIGSLKAKIGGAINAGCTKVIIPQENEQDYDKLVKYFGDKVTIVMASNITDVIKHALI